MATYTVHATDVVEKDGAIIGGIVDTVLKNPGDKAALQAAINAWNMAANAARESAIADNDAATKASYEQQKEQWIAEAVAEKDARIAELESQVAALTPSATPHVVTQRQFRLAILGAGINPDTVATAIESIQDEGQRAAALIEWEWASTIDRNNALVGLLAHAIGKTDADLDALFATAAQL